VFLLDGQQAERVADGRAAGELLWIVDEGPAQALPELSHRRVTSRAVLGCPVPFASWKITATTATSSL
jgi:hypothetical protein